MATLYISEYAEIHYGAAGRISQIPMEPPLARQTVAIGASSAASNPFNAATRIVRLHTDEICSIAFGVSPTATTSTDRMAANQTEYHGVPANSGLSVAVIMNS